MAAIADRVVHEFVEPFTFPNHHRRILEPYDYYQFGQVNQNSHPRSQSRMDLWMCLGKCS